MTRSGSYTTLTDATGAEDDRDQRPALRQRLGVHAVEAEHPELLGPPVEDMQLLIRVKVARLGRCRYRPGLCSPLRPWANISRRLAATVPRPLSPQTGRSFGPLGKEGSPVDVEGVSALRLGGVASTTI
jgi:hypothetical protein